MDTLQSTSSGIVPGLLPCYSVYCKLNSAMSFYPCYSSGCPRRKQKFGHAKLANPCTSYCCSRFLNYRDEPLTLANNSTFVPLNNPIHPIFDRARFRGDFDYSLLETPLRLASLLLESPGALEYINTMAGGELSERYKKEDHGVLKRFWKKTSWARIDAGGGSGGNSGRRWSDVRKSSKAEHLNGNALFQGVARDVLQRLSRAVTEFILSEPAMDINGSGGETHAVCVPDLRPMTARTVKAFPRGGCSTIVISRDDYMALYNLRKRQRRSNFLKPDEYRHELLLKQFLMANAIVHEIGHALSVVCCGYRPQVFHNDNPLGEAGFDLEHSIFDGIMGTMVGGFKLGCPSYWQRQDDCDTDLMIDHGLTVQEWPSWVTAGLYSSTGSAISILDGHWEPLIERSSRVPIRWLERLFDQRFWTETVPRSGKSALHPPRIASWVFALTYDRDGQPCKTACDLEDMVRPGFMSDKHRETLAEAMSIPISAVRDDTVVAGPSRRLRHVVPFGPQERRCCDTGSR